MTIKTEDIDTERPPPDFRRANGAPMIMLDGKNERYSRPSSFGKVLDDENALVNWKLNRAIAGVAKDPALQARAVAAKDDDRHTWNEIREASINAGRGDEAADIGTALHAMSERWEQEPTWDPGEPFRSSLEAYTAEKERLGLETELFEFHVVCNEYRTAGTCDRLYRLTRPLKPPHGDALPAGTLIIGDLKTGSSLEYSAPGYAVQMALYAQGELYDVEADQFVETPKINQDWGLIVHMPKGEAICEIVWVDLEVGNLGAYLVTEVKNWRKNWRNGTHTTPQVENPLDPRGWREVAADLNAEVLEGDELIEALIDFIKARVARLRDNEEAKALLMRKYPVGVPKPKDLVERGHIDLVLAVLDFVEAEFGIGFPEGDPRPREVTSE